MNFLLSTLILVSLTLERGEGFFSRFIQGRSSGSSNGNDKIANECETIRVMPRIAFAVVGGSPLKAQNSAPYIAAIGEKLSNSSVSWFCGGSLVSDRDIMTAAHCLVSRNVTTVRVGSFSTKKRTTENDYDILETIIHPSYKITQSYNDIAVVRVKNKISFSKNIKPVCLPEGDEDYAGQRATVIGWGAEEFGGEGSQKLQQVEVEVVSNSNCEKAYVNSTIAPKTFPKGIKKEQLCAGSSKGGKDACQGDSGGPLVLTDQNDIVRQIGIVSTGAGCGFKMYPGVYARVSSYTDWIQKQIKKKDDAKPRQNGGQSSKEQHGGQQETTSKRPSNNQSSNNGNGRPNSSGNQGTQNGDGGRGQRKPNSSGGQSSQVGSSNDRPSSRPTTGYDQTGYDGGSRAPNQHSQFGQGGSSNDRPDSGNNQFGQGDTSRQFSRPSGGHQQHSGSDTGSSRAPNTLNSGGGHSSQFGQDDTSRQFSGGHHSGQHSGGDTGSSRAPNTLNSGGGHPSQFGQGSSSNDRTPNRPNSGHNHPGQYGEGESTHGRPSNRPTSGFSQPHGGLQTNFQNGVTNDFNGHSNYNSRERPSQNNFLDHQHSQSGHYHS